MRKKMRLAMMILLALCCSALLMVNGALAASDFTVDNGRLTGYSGPGGEVNVPDGVRTIAASAFAHNTEITRIYLPWSVHTIESFAFSGCTELTYVEGVDHIETLGAGAFFGCSSMNSVWLPSDMTDVPSQLFYGCESLNGVNIPDTVQTIGASAFYGCSELHSITLPVDLTSIGDKAFANCANLNQVVLPTSVASMGTKAFSGCTSMSGITVMNAEMAIGTSAFPQNAALTVVGFADSTAQTYAQENGITFEAISESNEADDFLIDNGRLYQYLGTSAHVVIPEGVTEIDNYVFSDRESLLSVTMPDTVTRIGQGVFQYSRNLERVVLSASLESIGDSAFYGCKQLSEMDLPESLTSIGYNAFGFCWKLSEMNLPDSLTSIGSCAFGNCRALTSVSIPGSIESLESSTFYGCTALRSVTIGEGVTQIAERVFEECTSLVCVSLPQSLTSVGFEVFFSCRSLEEITFPQNVEQVGNNVLSGCRALRSVTFENPDVQIGNNLLSSTNYPVVYGHYGSDAEQSAREYGCEFVGCDCCEPEIVCNHPHAYQTYTTYNETYTADGALLTHSVTYDKTTYTYCPDCQWHYNHVHEKAITERQNHNWNEAEICYSCGQQNNCPHDNTELYTYETNHMYATIDSLREHMRIYDVYGYTRCLDCNVRLTEDAFIIKKAEKGGHWWDENNVCGGCKQANTCPHANTNDGENHADQQYISTGDLKTHTCIYDEYRYFWCGDCGFHSEEVLVAEDVVRTETHNWNRDTNLCYLCRQENTCPHEDIYSSTYWENAERTSTGDYKTHMVTYDLYQWSRCEDCNLHFDHELIESGKTTTESHSWDENNVCRSCEQENTCPHDNKWTGTEHDNWEYTSTGDVSYHEYTYDVYQITRCRDCNTAVSRTYKESVTEKRHHSWNEDDRCYSCGQLNACEHTGATREWVISSSEYAQLDDKQHIRTRISTIRIDCDVCRKQIGTREGTQTVTEEAHRFNAYGECRSCGASGVCAHENQYKDWNTNSYTYTDLGDGTHLYTREREMYMYCYDCNTTIGDAWTETEEKIQPHDRKNYCEDCGYSAPCAHADTYTLTDWLDMRYEVVNEFLHKDFGREKTYVMCRDCGEEISVTESKIERLLSQGMHSLEDGICRVCGYKSSCAHENTVEYLEYEYQTSSFAYVNEKFCSRNVMYSKQLRCADCGMDLYQITGFEELKETEEHEFYDGECDYCGYENSCAHDGEVSEYIGYNTYGSTVMVDEYTHIIDGKQYREISCALCGQYLRSEDSERALWEVPHEMWGSQCDYCDYRIDCAHANCTMVLETDDYSEFCTPVSDTEHEITYEQRRYFYCSDCQTTLKDMGSQFAGYATEVEAHTYENDSCTVCGYEKPAGPDKMDMTREEILADIGADITSVYQSGSTGYAVMTIQELLDRMDLYDGEITGSYGALTQKAVMNFQKEYGLSETGVCDYWTLIAIIDVFHGKEVPACPHVHTYEVALMDNQTFAYVDEASHTCTVDTLIRTRCRDCNETVSERSGGSFDMSMAHVYNDGLCACGMEDPNPAPENPCTHENVTPRFYKGSESVYTDLCDGLQHSVVRTGNMYNYCDDCGERVGECFTGTQEYDEPHDYVNGCPSCGFSRDCAHETQRTELEYVDDETHMIDEMRHGASGYLQTTVSCLDCGQQLSQTQPQEPELHRISLHDYSPLGECYACGYRTKCMHGNTTTMLDDTSLLGYAWRAANEKVHTMPVLYLSKTVCKDCGFVLSSAGSIVHKEMTKPHNFNAKGVCFGCGYANPCDHSGKTHTQQERGEWWGTYYIDENTHLEDAEQQTVTLCGDCGQEIAAENHGRQQLVKPHNMIGGICVDCEYMPCLHENMVTDTIANENDVLYVESVTEDRHTLICAMHQFAYCPDCSTLLTEWVSTVVGTASVNAPHDIVNGCCVKCGYRVENVADSVILTLPMHLLEVQEEAFAGGSFTDVICPEGMQTIGSRAFADCELLRSIEIPVSVTSIAEDAFEGSSPVIYGEEGSEAERFAQAHGLTFRAK